MPRSPSESTPGTSTKSASLSEPVSYMRTCPVAFSTYQIALSGPNVNAVGKLRPVTTRCAVTPAEAGAASAAIHAAPAARLVRKTVASCRALRRMQVLLLQVWPDRAGSVRPVGVGRPARAGTAEPPRSDRAGTAEASAET